MQISRRNFLQATTTAVTFVAASGGLRVLGQKLTGDLFPVPPEAYSDPLFSLTSRQAEAMIGTTFTATVPGGRTVRFTLTAVNVLARQGNILRGYYGESFSLIFESQQRVSLRQGVYKMSGDGVDWESVLLVPTGIERRHYEVMINHITR